jgi:hypothetical protein
MKMHTCAMLQPHSLINRTTNMNYILIENQFFSLCITFISNVSIILITMIIHIFNQ